MTAPAAGAEQDRRQSCAFPERPTCGVCTLCRLRAAQERTDAVRAASLDALHEIAWMLVLAGQSRETAEPHEPTYMHPPLVGELFRNQLAHKVIAYIEALT
jgi:hypothetical protein